MIEFFTYVEKPFQAKALMELYRDVNWWEERKEQDVNRVLKSGISVGAWNNNELIGFARAVSDGKFRAYIEDVVLHSEWRHSGIGKELVSKLLGELGHIDVISLFCGEHLIDFYKKNGFKPSRSQFVLHHKK